MEINQTELYINQEAILVKPQKQHLVNPKKSDRWNWQNKIGQITSTDKMIRIQNSRSLLTKTSVHEEKLYNGQCLSWDWKRQVGSNIGELEMGEEQKYGKTARARRKIRTVRYPKKYEKKGKNSV